MRFAAAALILASASVAIAQTTSTAAPQPTSNSGCQAQNIVDACREGIQTQIDNCEGNDFICLCDNYTNLLTCYNNCPDSNERPPVQNQVTQFCLAAAPLSSASKESAASVAKTAPPSSSTASETGTGTTAAATGFGSGTASATGASNTGAAAGLTIPIGGAFAALLALL